MNLSRTRLFARSATPILALVALAAGCAGTQTKRIVDKPQGMSTQYGAPANKTYDADVDLQRDTLRISLYEQSECEKFDVKLVERFEQTLENGDVVRSVPIGTAQRTEDSTGTVPCDAKYARDVSLGLRIGDATYALGTTNRYGQLDANLSDDIKQGLYGTPRTSKAILVAQGREGSVRMTQEVAKISLAELNKTQARIAQLINEMRDILDLDIDQLTPGDITRSYELYNQLGEIAPNDSRVQALRHRLIETYWQRKQVEKTENLRRNLAAYNELKGLLENANVTVPMFVRVGINSNEIGADQVNWAMGEAAVSARRYPQICRSANGFTWQSVTGDGVPGSTAVAFNIIRYAYGDTFVEQVNVMCRRIYP